MTRKQVARLAGAVPLGTSCGQALDPVDDSRDSTRAFMHYPASSTGNACRCIHSSMAGKGLLGRLSLDQY